MTYTFDAENRLVSPGTNNGTYLYDGDGNRMARLFSTSGTMYWRDLAGNPLLEDSNTGVNLREYIYFAGKRIARRDVVTNTVHYMFSDHLGSTSLITDALGTMAPCNGYVSGQFESDYFPYGGEIAICANVGDQNYKFTGKERDAETGLDYFGARFDASSFGRFMSLDSGGTPVLRNPQSLNLYAYTLNNPLRFVDPNGNAPIEIATYTVTIYHQATQSSNWVDSLLGIASALGSSGPQNQRMHPYWPDERPGSGGSNQLPMQFAKPSDFSGTGIAPDIAGFRSDFQAWSISVDFSGSGSSLAAQISFTQGFVIGGPVDNRLATRTLDQPTTVYGAFKFHNFFLLNPDQLKAVLAEAKRQYQLTGDPRYNEVINAVETEQSSRPRTCKEDPSQERCRNSCTMMKIDQDSNGSATAQ